MRKFAVGLALAVFAAASHAQSVITFQVIFDQVYEASGTFTPNLTPVGPGPFNNNQAVPPPNLTATVVLSAVPSGTQLTNANGALNRITLNGSFSTESGNSPSNGWSTHTFTAATFDLYKPASYFATDFVSNANDWAIFTATSTNGTLSDHGPAANYGGTCPFFFGCLSAASAGTPAGTTPYDLFDTGTPIYAGGAPVFPASFRDSGNYLLISGSATQTNPSTGLGFDNGMDAFAFQGVLDTTNSQGNGTSQPYPDGASGYPGKVRILTFSSTGNTAYMVQGHVVLDTDFDGVSNGTDNCPAVANAGQADTDADLRGNACDNCRLLANNTGAAAQVDSNGDGFGNRCDGDLNNNTATNAQDYVLFRQQLGAPSVAPTFNAADINANGAVNAQDYVLFRGLLGAAPGPGAGP